MPRFSSKSCFNSIILVISVSVLMQFFGSARGQSSSIPTPCSTSMIRTFTPCMNYLTGSSSNGTSSPTGDCCNSLRTIITAGIECACLILTANVPLPTSGVLTISLPSICNSPGVPIQCKATGTPLPPPGPVLFGPPPPPPPSARAARVAVPQAALNTASLPPAAAPDTGSRLPAAAPVDGGSETKSSSGDQIRTVLNPSGSSPSCTISYTALVLVSIGMVLLKLY